MDERSDVHLERGTTNYKAGGGQLYAEPHVRQISCHVASLPCQEPEQELNKLLLTKFSDRDHNVNVKNNVGCVLI